MSRGSFWAAVPLLALPVGLYNAVTLLAVEEGFSSPRAAMRYTGPVIGAPLPSGALWTLSLGDLLVIAALAVLFIELLKSRASRGAAVVNYGLSIALLVVCLLEFLLVDAFATTSFFLIGLMVLLDVLAGFVVSVAAAGRDR